MRSRLLSAAIPFAVLASCLLGPAALPAQGNSKSKDQQLSGYDRAARATVLHTANVYVSADASTPPISSVTPGHEIVVVAHNGPWISAFANTDAKDEDPDTKPEFEDPATNPNPGSGWMRDKGIVGAGTPSGDVLLYGAAAELEAAAAQPHAPKDAAGAAHLLYRRVYEYFPNSTLAAEAAFRSADIRWQLEQQDIKDLPSAHEQEAYLRPQIYEGELKHVIKLYPESPFAARAAFDLIDNKLCGDWQGLPKCPEMETGLYLKYADRYPGGPKSAEALYNAAYRQGVLVTMYTVDENKRKADTAAASCQKIADEARQKYPASDFASRAVSIAFRVQQGIAVYGNDRQ